MLTADPRVVESTRLVPSLSFAEAAELAYFGAKVLHPKSIQPAAARNIPVRILNTFRPEAPGTSSRTAPRPRPSPVTALACKKGITVVTTTSTGMLMAYGYMRRLFEVFERHRTPVDVVSTSEVSVSVTIDDRTHLESIVAALSTFAEVSVSPSPGAGRRGGRPLWRRPDGVLAGGQSPRRGCPCGWCRRRTRAAT